MKIETAVLLRRIWGVVAFAGAAFAVYRGYNENRSMFYVHAGLMVVFGILLFVRKPKGQRR
jgi:hypothetical protein